MTPNSELASYFEWTRFYEEFADKLLAFRNNRFDLINGLHRIVGTDERSMRAANYYDMRPLRDYEISTDDPPMLLEDICPFTVMGLFNHDVKFHDNDTTDNARKDVAEKLAAFLGVDVPVPDNFETIPVIGRMQYWFFGYTYRNEPDDIIESLWDLFVEARQFSDSRENRDLFVKSYNVVARFPPRARNLTTGLYWMRPGRFQYLDDSLRDYISNMLGIAVDDYYRDAERYLFLLDSLKEKFQEPNCPVHSFQQLTFAAHSENPQITFLPTAKSEEDRSSEPQSYAIDHIFEEGCFLGHSKLAEILKRLEEKQNLILQGPPGTGKTWLAKRLAYALIGQKDTDKVRSVQFHPNMSYEDFVRGYRPSPDGKLDLVDGPFIETIDAAKADPTSKYVIVIEEINRGNPVQIFGEMLTLLEADKRTPDEALELTYRKHDGERVHIPENLYVIGTMNMADRSLAMVDFALRRRFAFINMEPALNERWSGWVHEQSGIRQETLSQIKSKLDSLNQTIAEDPNLGPQFAIGHSFVTPNDKIDNADEWFRQVVETEIGPLLDEYWYDNREKAQEEQSRLLSGI